HRGALVPSAGTCIKPSRNHLTTGLPSVDSRTEACHAPFGRDQCFPQSHVIGTHAFCDLSFGQPRPLDLSSTTCATSRYVFLPILFHGESFTSSSNFALGMVRVGNSVT